MFIVNLIASGVRIMTPYLLGALGGIYAVRSGITMLCIEGIMLTGAFTGFLGAYATGSPWMGILFAGVFGVLAGTLHAFLCVNVGANQVVSGTVINLAAVGLTSFFFTLIFGKVSMVQIQKLPVLPIPLLSSIPVVGEIFFKNSVLTYFAFLMVPVTWWFLYRTPAGLQVRAVGENPRAADSLGVRVHATRYLCCVVSGCLAAFGGAFVTLEMVSSFTEGISSGKGYIALAALMLGRRNPVGIVFSCLLFGITEALQFRLQTYRFMGNIPVEFIQMLPYVAAVVAMVVSVGKSKPPAAVGKPYFKE